MTERQRALLEALPKHNNILSKAAESVGYSKETCKSKIYSLVRNSKGMERKSEDAIREVYIKETRKLKKKFLKAGDSTNASRMHEVEGKAQGIFKDGIQANQGNTIIIDRQGLIHPPKVAKVDINEVGELNTINPIDTKVEPSQAQIEAEPEKGAGYAGVGEGESNNKPPPKSTSILGVAP